MNRWRIKAGILPLTLALSVVISGICTAMIIAAYYFRLTGTRYDLDLKLNDNAMSGFNYLMGQFDLLDDNTPYFLDLFGNGHDSVMVQKKRWGVFHILTSQAYQGNQRAWKTSLIGFHPTEKGRSALYLSDERSPLTIAGDVFLNGDCYLPKSGVRTTYINRIGYSKKELVHGKQLESKESSIPAVNPELLKSIKRLCGQEFGQDYDLLQEAEDGDTIRNSFYNALTLYYHSAGAMAIVENIKGNVLVHSPVSIKVSARARLEDVILVAPFIEIEDGFSGQAQFFAKDSIKVGDGCRIYYPSALVLYNDKGEISLGKKTEVKGLIFMAGESDDFASRTLGLEEESMVTGQVYVDGYVEHKGEVHGNLTCRKFLLRMEHSVYENHLFNGKIDGLKLPEYFTGADLYEYSDKKSVIKWLR
jgi:hypothetical protein